MHGSGLIDWWHRLQLLSDEEKSVHVALAQRANLALVLAHQTGDFRRLIGVIARCRRRGDVHVLVVARVDQSFQLQQRLAVVFLHSLRFHSTD